MAYHFNGHQAQAYRETKHQDYVDQRAQLDFDRQIMEKRVNGLSHTPNFILLILPEVNEYVAVLFILSIADLLLIHVNSLLFIAT
jgi:hypothetical protein